MPVHHAVREIASRYEIEVEVSPEPLKHKEAFGIAVFLGCGLSIPERKIWVYEGSEVFAQLHELSHVITHPIGCGLNLVRENFILMQVERELARTMLPKREFRQVVKWQQETAVSDDDYLYDPHVRNPYWRDHDIWLGGYQRAQQVGLLDERRRPTFQKPVWPKDPVEWYAEWMREHDYIHSDTTIEELRGLR